jgi:competence protein ComEC
MYKSILLFFAILLLAKELSTSKKDLIVFWNVGQGSWTSILSDDACLHVDAGGRHRPLSQHCRSRKNYLWFTHYDWDHISLARKIFMLAPDTCLMQKPPNHLKDFKKKFLNTIPLCEGNKTTRLQKRFIGRLSWVHRADFVKTNDSSVFLLAQTVLITGDATQKMEKTWLNKIPLHKVQILLAGHHGSRTSLSPLLLKKALRLRMAIISAEKKKYGHPHKETVEKLRRAHIPMVKTEDFGSIAVELP